MQLKFWGNLFFAKIRNGLMLQELKKGRSWYILEIESVRFADEIDGDSEEDIKDEPEIWDFSNIRVAPPTKFQKTERCRWQVWRGQSWPEALWAQLHLFPS